MLLKKDIFQKKKTFCLKLLIFRKLCISYVLDRHKRGTLSDTDTNRSV